MSQKPSLSKTTKSVSKAVTGYSSVLPDWLSFDATTGTFTGVPPLDSSGDILVTVTASDGELSVSDEFILTVSSDDTGSGGGGGGTGGGTATLTGQVDGTQGADLINATFLDAEGEAVSGGADTVYTLGGDDIINTGGGNDIVYGGAGDDTFQSNTGTKTYFGEGGNDSITVVNSSFVDGGAGNDYLYSSLNKGGDHTFTGGTGADIFEFNYASTKEADQIITDFEVGTDILKINDRWVSGIELSQLDPQFTTSVATDGSLVIEYGGIHSVTLQGLTESEFFA